MSNPYAHDPDYDFWFDHYEIECTCRASASCLGPKPPAADPAQDLRVIRAEIAELRRRIEQLEARVVASVTRFSNCGRFVKTSSTLQPNGLFRGCSS